MTRLEYSKEILQKVSFSKSLFAKELLKSKRSIKSEDLPDLKSWCESQFATRYQSVIRKSFNE